MEQGVLLLPGNENRGEIAQEERTSLWIGPRDNKFYNIPNSQNKSRRIILSKMSVAISVRNTIDSQ